MSFTESEAKAKIGKTVSVQSDGFSEDGIVKGTTGRVSVALCAGKVGLGVGNHFTTAGRRLWNRIVLPALEVRFPALMSWPL
jgi:hypothetical protein